MKKTEMDIALISASRRSGLARRLVGRLLTPVEQAQVVGGGGSCGGGSQEYTQSGGGNFTQQGGQYDQSSGGSYNMKCTQVIGINS